MYTTSRYTLILILLLFPALAVHAHDVAIPAGTLMECTLNEPAFSSATTSVGDPFLCYPRNIQEFGHSVFPRGTYIVGHLEDAKDPGHFVGKGYLKMAIDRIGLPATDIPVNAKVISVSGYKVDRHGDVIGHGHATRDVVEWTLPPLWPWKVLTLPAKGPRPTLKGEVRMTLRIMDDFVVPQDAGQGHEPPRAVLPLPRQMPGKGWHLFGSPAEYPQRTSTPAGRAIAARYVPSGDVAPVDSPTAITAAVNTAEWPANVTVFALKDRSVLPVQQYWRDGQALVYVLTTGDKGAVLLERVDWSSTSRLNWQRGIRVSLHGPAGAEATGQ